MAEYRIETVREGYRSWTARNDRGAEVRIGAADDPDVQPSFSPVELLLAAMGGCGGMVVDRTARAVDHEELRIVVESATESEDPGRLGRIRVSYEFVLPESNPRAAEVFARAVRLTHEKFCTVSRTVEHGTEVEAVLPDGTVGFRAG
ncbi:OsmC family protein [Streptomyces sp. NBC_01216]|uniref:OsmC family protein n=1 Tax=unclassified Streptomyces TaxID=2593676 RepID=UPI002E14CC15|nr:OsmC family protein [Streptomyces sp. NBC_01216]